MPKFKAFRLVVHEKIFNFLPKIRLVVLEKKIFKGFCYIKPI